jgi:outer membrane immunogenic protein
MKRVFAWVVASIAMIGSATAAFAADMPLKAQPALAPVLTWSGWYAGLNAGGIWSNAGNASHSAVAGPCDAGAVGCNPAVPALNLGTLLATGSTFDAGLGNGAGFIGGGQFGYNWQFNNSAVLGFEADIAWTGQSGQATFASTNVLPAVVGIAGAADPYNATISAHLDYLGTVRGRLGLLATPSLLVYGTGGLAYGGVRSTTTETVLAVPPALCAGAVCAGSGGGAFSDTRVGWTAGAGAEWMFARNWSAKVEYLYYDLGRASYATNLRQTCTGGGCLFNGIVIASTTGISTVQYAGSVARIGLNYHFGGPTATTY